MLESIIGVIGYVEYIEIVKLRCVEVGIEWINILFLCLVW